MITGAAILMVGLLVGCLFTRVEPSQKVLNRKLTSLFSKKATIVDMKNPLDIQL